MGTSSNAKIATTDQWKLSETGTGDRLSSLPDEIISHILSFLQTKYAVGTAVLSRRWKDLWTRVPNLDLDDSLVYHRQPRKSYGNISQNMPPGEISENQENSGSAFSQFVDRVLSQHNNLDSVRRFRLQVKSDVRPIKMELGSESMLEEFDAKVRYEFQLPKSFYALKHLKVLKLFKVSIVNTDGSVVLPSLKILQLLKVEPKDRESLRRLISDCPVLETVHLEKCYYTRYSEQPMVIASSQSVKSLSIIDRHASIVIEAPSLEYLHLDVRIQAGAELRFLGTSTVFPCLDSAWVDITWGEPDPPHCLVELLNKISNAKRIHLSLQTLVFLAVPVYHGVQLPAFPNLTHLTMGVPDDSSILYSLLNSASKLRSLSIDTGKLNWKGRMKWGPEPDCAPKCLLSSLEEIVIENFVDSGADAMLAAYLLKFGALLKKVNVLLLFGLNSVDRKALASLLKLPRRSSACEVHFQLSNGDEIHINSSE